MFIRNSCQDAEQLNANFIFKDLSLLNILHLNFFPASSTGFIPSLVLSPLVLCFSYMASTTTNPLTIPAFILSFIRYSFTA
jgi:hypothetical protein